MRNYVQNGVNLTLPAPTNITSGSVVIVGSIIGIAAESALSGDDLDLVTRGVFTLPKVAALAIAIGDKVYWNAASALATKTTTDTLIGVAVSAAANPSASVAVKLNGGVN